MDFAVAFLMEKMRIQGSKLVLCTRYNAVSEEEALGHAYKEVTKTHKDWAVLGHQILPIKDEDKATFEREEYVNILWSTLKTKALSMNKEEDWISISKEGLLQAIDMIHEDGFLADNPERETS